MARPIPCGVDGCREQAVVMITNLQNGDTEAYCGPHYVLFTVQLADEFTRDDQADGAHVTLEVVEKNVDLDAGPEIAEQGDPAPGGDGTGYPVTEQEVPHTPEGTRRGGRAKN